MGNEAVNREKFRFSLLASSWPRWSTRLRVEQAATGRARREAASAWVFSSVAIAPCDAKGDRTEGYTETEAILRVGAFPASI